MKKIFLTSAIALSTLLASAQNFMVVTTYDGDQEETMDKITQNIGFGYALNDTWTVGLLKNGVDAEGDDNYDLWGRYNWNANTYVSVQAPTEETMDNLTVGVGYSYNVWKGLNVEPNYSMGLKEDENGEREGTFNLGLSYKF
jgi:opacity protein-like surface antigen